MAQIEGKCEPRFEAVRGALAQYLDSGEERGASLVVDIDGDRRCLGLTGPPGRGGRGYGFPPWTRRSPGTGRSSRRLARKASWSAI